MLSGFQELSSETQIIVGRTTKIGQKVQNLLNQYAKGGPAAAEALKGLQKLGIDEDEVKRLSRITNPINKTLQAMRSIAPAEQFKARFEALTKAAGVPIDINSKNIKNLFHFWMMSRVQEF